MPNSRPESTPFFTEADFESFSTGIDARAYHRLGSHPACDGENVGTRFVVWAPNASRVAVVGDCNDWNWQLPADLSGNRYGTRDKTP